MGKLLPAAWVLIVIASAAPATVAHGFGPGVAVPAPCSPSVVYGDPVHHHYDVAPNVYLRHGGSFGFGPHRHLTGWTGWRTDYVWRHSGPHAIGYRWR